MRCHCSELRRRFSFEISCLFAVLALREFEIVKVKSVETELLLYSLTNRFGKQFVRSQIIIEWGVEYDMGSFFNFFSILCSLSS